MDEMMLKYRLSVVEKDRDRLLENLRACWEMWKQGEDAERFEMFDQHICQIMDECMANKMKFKRRDHLETSP